VHATCWDAFKASEQIAVKLADKERRCICPSVSAVKTCLAHACLAYPAHSSATCLENHVV
jgi:hypothetical protein